MNLRFTTCLLHRKGLGIYDLGFFFISTIERMEISLACRQRQATEGHREFSKGEPQRLIFNNFPKFVELQDPSPFMHFNSATNYYFCNFILFYLCDSLKLCGSLWPK